MTKISTSALCTAPAVLAATWINGAIRTELPERQIGHADPQLRASTRRRAMAHNPGPSPRKSYTWYPVRRAAPDPKQSLVAGDRDGRNAPKPTFESTSCACAVAVIKASALEPLSRK